MRNTGKGKRWVWIALCMALICCMALTAGIPAGVLHEQVQAPEGQISQGQRIFDGAALFTQEELASLEACADEMSLEAGADLAVVTAYNDNIHTAEAYADDFYDTAGFGTGKDKSGALLLIYMDAPGETGGEMWISSFGTMIRILTDERIEKLEDDVAYELQRQDYAEGARVFLKKAQYYADLGIQSGQYNYDRETGEISRYRSIRWYEAAFALIISLVTAAGACMGVKQGYKLSPSDRQVKNSLLSYRSGCCFRFKTSEDDLVNKYVTSSRISHPAPSSGSGSSGGRQSSGRSTTHRSSSGRSHGGGGRRF